MGWYLNATDLTLILPAGVSIGTNTIPLTLDEVATIISKFEAEADGYAAAAGYAVPVATGATYGFGIMRQAIENGAAAFVLGVLFPTMGGPGDKTSLAVTYRNAYNDFKRDIAKGNLTLVGASPGADGGGRALPRTGSTASSRVPIDWEP